MNGIALYFRYARIHLREGFQYKGWILGMLMTLLFTLTDPFEAFLMLSRFGAIGGVSPARIIAVYAMAVLAFGTSELVARGFDSFPGIVRSGHFDRLLLRPRSLFLQVFGERFHLHRLSRVLGAAAMLVLAVRADGSRLSMEGALMLVLAWMGGTLTYTGTFALIGTPAFWTMQSLEWVNIFTNGSYQVAKLPYHYVPAWLRRMFLYVMPMFVFCYFPVAAAFRWEDTPPLLGWLALPVGAVYCVLGILIWRWGARYYKSAGN